MRGKKTSLISDLLDYPFDGLQSFLSVVWDTVLRTGFNLRALFLSLAYLRNGLSTFASTDQTSVDYQKPNYVDCSVPGAVTVD